MELPLSKKLYEETQSLHAQTENMDFIVALRNQKLTQAQYIRYLADLKTVYESLERGMRANVDNPVIHIMYDEKLNRTLALEQDLKSFGASDTKPSQAAIDYANHLLQLSKHSPVLLLAHAYVRYLGDLSGGRMLKKLVEQIFPGNHTAFYNFDQLLGPQASGAQFVEYKNSWKERLDGLELTENDKFALINEAKKSFELTGKIFSKCFAP